MNNKIENNLDEVLKSLNPQKALEEKKRGMINIQEKGFIFKQKEESNFQANKNFNNNFAFTNNNFNGGEKNLNKFPNNNLNKNNNINNQPFNSAFNYNNIEVKMKQENKTGNESEYINEEDLRMLDDILTQYSEEKQEKKDNINTNIKTNKNTNINSNINSNINTNNYNSRERFVNNINTNTIKKKEVYEESQFNRGICLNISNLKTNKEVKQTFNSNATNNNYENSSNSNAFTSNFQNTNTDNNYDELIYQLDDEDLKNLLGDNENDNEYSVFNINQIEHNRNINFDNLPQNNNNNINKKNNYENANNNQRRQDFSESDDLQVNNNGDFIEQYCQNHKVANLKEWSVKFPWDEIVDNANLRVFGYKTFRPNQREIINASLSGRDIFVCMPTGGGKSLTFQIPALISDGVTIVIMPLISLIQDQVSAMHGLGINVIFLNAEGERDMDENFNKYFMNEDSEESCKMIFVTPEKIAQSTRTKNTLQFLYSRNLIGRFAIDEAHCLSQWGREFRPDYLNLKMLRREYPRVPLLAITATAPNKVREDIITQLSMRECLFFRSSYNRNNLYIEIRNKKDMSDVVANMANFIKKKYPEASGLIYCASKKECENLSEKLKKDHGLSVHYYHAAMNDKLKYTVQEKWKNDEIKIIVATIAFGMGINKADVRYVIHHAMPKSFENYYQEIGRAGRDGKKSHCLLYYTPSDRRTLEFLMHKSNMAPKLVTQNLRKITEMIEYCEEFCECRRVIALLYFDERFDRNDCMKMCDNCRKNLHKEEKDVTQDCIKILNFMRSCHNCKIDVTCNQTIDYMRGKKDKNKNKKYPQTDNNLGVLKNVSQDNLKKMIRRLLILKYINETLIAAGDKCFSVMSISNEGLDYLSKRNYTQGQCIIITFPRPVSANNYEVENNSNDNNAGNFIEKNSESKDLNDYNYNINDDVEVLNKLTTANKAKVVLEENKKKERKYNRTNKIENLNQDNNNNNNVNPASSNNNTEKKNKNIIPEDDFGYCTQEQFEELLDKLKIKRREILKEANKKIEAENSNNVDVSNNNISNPAFIKKKLNGEEIFPVTGLKELCRKLPTSEKELDSNYIFGVGAKFLHKYGKEFLPEIVKHVNLYKIAKKEDNFQEVVNTSIVYTSKKKSATGYSLLDAPIEKTEIKTNNNVIGGIKNINRSFIKDNPNRNVNTSNKIDNKLEQASNNNAMFNSMSDKKTEIVIDFNNGIIKADSQDILSSFLKDIEKFSHDSKKSKPEEEKVPEANSSDLSDFFEQINSWEKPNNKKKESNIASNIINPNSKRMLFPNNNIGSTDHNDFNNFDDINNVENFNEFLNNEIIIEKRGAEEDRDNQEEEMDEFSLFAKNVKEMNSNLNKSNKKRKGKDVDNEEEEKGEKRKKDSKSEYFKKRALFNKFNKNKKNNFL